MSILISRLGKKDIKISQLAQTVCQSKTRCGSACCRAPDEQLLWGGCCPEFPLIAAYLVCVDLALHVALCFPCYYSCTINGWSCGNEWRPLLWGSTKVISPKTKDKCPFLCRLKSVLHLPSCCWWGLKLSHLCPVTLNLHLLQIHTHPDW